MQGLLLYTTVEEESKVRKCSHRTPPSTLKGRMRGLLLYTTVEEESKVRDCSHPTPPSTDLEGGM